MKQWIKLETDIMYNHGVRRLYAEHRQAGLCVYILLRLHIAALSENGIPHNEAVLYGVSLGQARELVKKVIDDYGLFTERDGNVMPVSLCTDGCAGGCTEGCTQGCAPEPIQDENRKERCKKKKQLSEDEVQWQKDFKAHYPQLARMKMPLTRFEYQRLLDRYPNELIINKLEHMNNVANIASKYVSVYRTLLNWLKD